MSTENTGEDGQNKGTTGDSVASKPPGTPAGIVPYKGMLLRTADCLDSDMETPVKVFDIYMWQLIALAAMVCLAVSLIVTFVLCVLLFRMRVTKELEMDLQDRQPMKPDLGDTTSYVSYTSPDEDIPDDHPIKIAIQDSEMEEREDRNEPRPDIVPTLSLLVRTTLGGGWWEGSRGWWVMAGCWEGSRGWWEGGGPVRWSRPS
uniref:Uncharacterized protein n=1 Tax=Branchiostoma floridae TaxID=7739 RepID=C3XYC1_BRAFL|eukprot:XP_002610796.1 hypothetical protein BRAFLDRAFT_91588 [Branchiostoma floridae]